MYARSNQILLRNTILPLAGLVVKYSTERLLNTAEAARFLRVSQASIRRWSDSGLLAARRVGRRRERRFSESDLQTFMQQPATAHAAAGASTVNVGGERIGVPGHLATLYSTDAGGLRLTLPFLAEGLRGREPCFLVATNAELRRYTEALGDQEEASRDGLFSVVSFRDGTAAGAITEWEAHLAASRTKGPTVIRIVGEMVSEREMFISEEEMLRYEEAFEVMCRRYPVVVICQYDVRQFDGVALLRALKAHPDLFGRMGTFLN